MPSRGLYEIANVEEGKAAQRDQSYKSCVVTLLIIFFLCMILILATLPWKIYNSSERRDNYDETQDRQYYKANYRTITTISSKDEGISEEIETINSVATNTDSSKSMKLLTKTEAITTNRPISSTTSKRIDNYSTIKASSFTENEAPSTLTTEKYGKYTEASTIGAISTDRISINGSAPDGIIASGNATAEISVDENTTAGSITAESFTGETISRNNTNGRSTTEASIFTKLSSITQLDTKFTRESEETTTIEVTTESSFNSATKSEENTTIEAITESLFNFTTKDEENSITEITVESPFDFITKGKENVTIEATTESSLSSTTRGEENTTIEATTESLSNSTTISYTDHRNERNAIINATTASTFNYTIKNEEDTTIQTTTESSFSSTTANPIEKNTCTTGKCKNLASKMVFYMDHSADPCDDFYEYACGRFEADPTTTELDLKDVAHRRMLRQIEKENGENVTSLLIKYYNSCMQYENVNQTERIKLAKKMLNEVGQFYTTETWAGNQAMTNFTELLAQLLLHNSALLFDVTPDLNETSPKLFTFKIGPATYPFDTDETNDHCYASQNERETETLDLQQLYTEYKSCKKNMTAFINSISEAMIALDLQYLYNQTGLLPALIDTMIVQPFKNLSSKGEIRERYLMKNYTRVTILELARDFKVVNWTKLICLLTKEHIVEDESVQVYFYEDLAKLLKHFEELNDDDPMHLHNALLGLYARNLYHELVLSKHQDAKKHCISEAARLLVPEISNLYISSFSKDELTYMSESIRSLFEELKETLKLKIKEAKWATEEGRNAIIAKINDLKVAVPDISYLTDSYSTYKIKQADKVNLTDNYIENSVILMRRFRKLMYAEFFKNQSNHPEQIWTHYATPYQSKALAIYGLNLVVIPFGAIDWSIKYDNSSFDYIKLATLGNVIAHQIAHHFDANGIYYWNGTRNAKKSLLSDNYTNTNFEEYIENQRNMYGGRRSMNMILPSTGQNVTYNISQLSLNERLSEATGLRLAYDTLDRLRSSKEVLPWLELNYNQLFYLTYAQMHCTKSPLTSSYISLYENEQLPSRIRIFVSASNNKLLGETWKCPDGSRIMPSYTSDVFPYLEEATNDDYDS